MDLAFEQLLAEHNQDFKDSEVYSTWMPDDGDYIVTLVKFDSGSKVKDGVKTAWFKLTGRIEDVQDENLNGKEFLVNFYRSTAYGILKGDARILSGNPNVNDLKEAFVILESSIGTVIQVRVSTSFSEKYKKDFTNCYIREVINTTTEASAEDVSDAADPAPVTAPVEDEDEVAQEAPVVIE